MARGGLRTRRYAGVRAWKGSWLPVGDRARARHRLNTGKKDGEAVIRCSRTSRRIPRRRGEPGRSRVLIVRAELASAGNRLPSRNRLFSPSGIGRPNVVSLTPSESSGARSLPPPRVSPRARRGRSSSSEPRSAGGGGRNEKPAAGGAGQSVGQPVALSFLALSVLSARLERSPRSETRYASPISSRDTRNEISNLNPESEPDLSLSLSLSIFVSASLSLILSRSKCRRYRRLPLRAYRAFSREKCVEIARASSPIAARLPAVFHAVWELVASWCP